jgi:hypothetical protein
MSTTTRKVGTTVRTSRACGICREPGHNRSNCPNPNAAAERREAELADLKASLAAAAAAEKAREPARIAAREARYAHLVATDPDWAAWDAKRKHGALIREAYKAGDRSTPELQAMQEVLDGMTALKARLTAATTVADFEACREVLQPLDSKADDIEWSDPINGDFTYETERYIREAISWLTWMKENPAGAAAHAYAVEHEYDSDSDYRGPSPYELRPNTDMLSESLEEARKRALDYLDYFLKTCF